MKLSALELCAGGGGQALGLELAGFDCAAAVEIESQFCQTLRQNRPRWNVIEEDVRNLRGRDFRGVDLLAAGVPCPPFSIAGKQLGSSDERDLFPEALRLIDEIRPPALMLENVPGFASSKFSNYRRNLLFKLHQFGYEAEWRVLNASDFGVPQLRPRFILVGLKPRLWNFFEWPDRNESHTTVGQSLKDLMAANGWPGSTEWANKADRIAPTIVGGFKKHGGSDLGPTRAKRQWRELGVDAMGIADLAPGREFPRDGLPRLTVKMVSHLQSFPDEWEFSGRKTAAYRQVGNAFPPLVAKAVGLSLMLAFGELPLDRRSKRIVPVTMRLFEKPKKYTKPCLAKKTRSN